MGGCCEIKKEHIQLDFNKSQILGNKEPKTSRGNKIFIQYKLNDEKEDNYIFKIKNCNSIDIPILKTKIPYSIKNNNSLNKNNKNVKEKNIDILIENYNSDVEPLKKNSLSIEKNNVQLNTETSKFYFPFDYSVQNSEKSYTNKSFKKYNSLRKFKYNNSKCSIHKKNSYYNNIKNNENRDDDYSYFNNLKHV